jgi:hypothetical protein
MPPAFLLLAGTILKNTQTLKRIHIRQDKEQTMASPTLTDKELELKYGRRSSGTPIDFPHELGYICPKGHTGDYLDWSEFNDHIWCYQCKLDYHYAHDCHLKRMCWMSDKLWNNFINGLPIKPQILEGIQHFYDCYTKIQPYKRAKAGGTYKTKQVSGYSRLIPHKRPE